MESVTSNTINKAHQHIIQVMKMIFWLASENLPLHKFKSFINFLHFIRVPYIKASNDNGSMYDNHTTSLEMLDALAQTIEDKIWQDLATCSAFGIMLDESTDITIESHVILYVKYCLYGVIKVRYLKLLQLESADAQTIYNAVIALFDKKRKLNLLFIKFYLYNILM